MDTTNLFRLDGRIALVTGGSRGIGKMIAAGFIAQGAKVYISSRKAPACEDTAAELGPNCIPLPMDVSTVDGCRALAAALAEREERLDILVNNAAAPGGIARGPLSSISDDDVLDDLNTKVVGYLRCARAVGPYMTDQGWGRIVNIGGLSARNANGANVSAGIRNAGLVNLTKYLSQQLGPSGVTVNLVHPGATRTERSGPMYEEQARQQGISVEEVEARVAANNATNRIVDASELAYVVAFLASPRSIAISGEVIAAGGGSGQAVYH